MIETIIKQLFHTNTYTLTKLDKGLTNHNYLLCVKNEKYIVRIPQKDNSHLFNRKNEKIVHDLVRDLDVECIYFNEENGIKITKYIDHLYEFEECPYEDKVERCALLMKKLHTLPPVDFHFNPFQTLQNYKEHVKKPLYDLSKYEKEIEKVKTFKNKDVLCHNDFVSGNILYGKDRDYLIDYEYGASNDPLFDVISFLSENQIFDKTLRERFYHVYFDTLTHKTREQLYLWEMFQNVLWCYWAMMMYEARWENIYKEIAQDKYNALIKMKKDTSLWF